VNNAVKAAAKRAPKKVNIAAAVAPERQEVVIKSPAVAYHVGTLTMIQGLKHLLTHEVRSFGEAIDRLQQLEGATIAAATTGIHAMLKNARIKSDDRNITTMAHPEGPRIVLTTPPKAEPAPGADISAAPAANDAKPKRTRAPKAVAPAAAPAPIAKATRAPRKLKSV
jgi:hypothetical protein